VICRRPCVICLSEFEFELGRRGINPRYCSSRCRAAAQTRRRKINGQTAEYNEKRRVAGLNKNCIDCQKFLPHSGVRCKKCHYEYVHQQRRRKTRRVRAIKKLAQAAKGEGPRWVFTTGFCVRCGNSYVTWVPSLFCSKVCKGSYKTGGAKKRRKAHEAGWKLTRARRIEIYWRDKWICQLCLTPVAQALLEDCYNPAAPSVDHRIPLSAGGLHEMDNCQLAHLECNWRKGARIGT
jgi:hypothetical protein